jgi:DNA-binding MarR family transcriptional regulator
MDKSELINNITESNNLSLFLAYFKMQSSIISDNKGALIMKNLYEQDEMSLNVLQKQFNLSQYKFYEEVARLEGALFIEFRKDPSDKRQVIIKLSPIGSYVYENILRSDVG